MTKKINNLSVDTSDAEREFNSLEIHQKKPFSNNKD
jgi:hypothetical protein